MKRIEQLTLIASIIALSWLGMQAVHELGHAVGAWATGGQVSHVSLHPLSISRTDLSNNPHPLAVVWAGPVIGSVLPLLLFLIVKVCRFGFVYLFRFFAAFCLIANGAYIAFGPGRGELDTGVIVALGTPRWVMIAFGVLTIPLGLYLMHGEGKHFGLGEAKGKVSRPAIIFSLLVLVFLIVIELLFFGK